MLVEIIPAADSFASQLAQRSHVLEKGPTLWQVPFASLSRIKLLHAVTISIYAVRRLGEGIDTLDSARTGVVASIWGLRLKAITTSHAFAARHFLSVITASHTSLKIRSTSRLLNNFNKHCGMEQINSGS